MVLYGTLSYGMGAYYRWVLSTDGCEGRGGGAYAYCKLCPNPDEVVAPILLLAAYGVVEI